MAKSVKKNYIYNLIYQLFLIIVPLAVTPYVSRVLGVDGVGQYSYTYSIVTYFTLFAALGFAYYAQREIAKHQGEKKQQSIVFWEVFIARLIPVALVLIVYLFLAGFGVYGEKYNTLMLIMAINVVAVAFDVSFFLQGNEDFAKLVIRSVIIKVLGIAAIFIFVNDSDDVWVYTLIQSLTVILANLSLWLYLPKILTRVSIKELRPLRHLKPTLILFLPTIAISIYTSLDKTMIGIITGSDSENGNYEQAEKIVKMLMTIITSLGTVMIPRNSNKFKEGDIEGVRRNIYTSCKFVFFMGVPLCLGIICVADNVVPWFFGDGYDKAANIMKILSPIIIIIGLSNVFGLQFLIPTGRDKKYTAAVICGAVSNFVINIFLIYYLQSYGAAIATVIAETIVTTVMLIFIRKDINFLKILKNSFKYIIAGIVMFVPCYFMGVYLSPSIINTLLIVIVGAATYFLMLLVLRDRFFIDNVKSILNKVFRKKSGETKGENK